MKHLPANSAPQRSLRGSKSAAVASRLAVKRQGVKAVNGKVIKHMHGKRSLAGSDELPKARASRTPRGLLAIKGDLLPATPSTYVGRLSSVADWHRQVGKVY